MLHQILIRIYELHRLKVLMKRGETFLKTKLMYMVSVQETIHEHRLTEFNEVEVSVRMAVWIL